MAPVEPSSVDQGSGDPSRSDQPSSASRTADSKPADPQRLDQRAAALSTPELIAALQADRQWLLRQLDQGAWSHWRLDLAALERELGELLERATELSAG